MTKQPSGSSPDALPLDDQLLELLLGLPEPTWFDWVEYGSRGVTSEHESALIDIATDVDLLQAEWDAEEGWAPVHAWRCLAELRSERAVTPLLEVLDVGGPSHDWMLQDYPNVFATIGPAAVAPLVAFAADRSRETYARMTAAEALGKIGETHQSAREACVEGLTRVLEGFADEELELNAAVIGDLVTLDAREVAPLMRAAFAADCVDLVYQGDWEDVQIDLGLLDERRTPRPRELKGWDLREGRETPHLPDWRSLGEAQAEVFERVLSRPTQSGDALTPRQLEGLLFTVACAPDLVRPSEWIALLTEEVGVELEDDEEAEAFLRGLITLYGAIQNVVNQPYFEAPEGLFLDDLMSNLQEDTEVAQWSRGFILGHGWLEDEWTDVPEELEAVLDRELGAVMLALSFFAFRSMAERYQTELGGAKVTLEEMADVLRRGWNDALIDYADLGRALYRERMGGSDTRWRPVRAEPRPGRNDPCPCGSGRKYKKCCWAK